jgi:CO/xanthine dehydrogenase FAD-binding subunit
VRNAQGFSDRSENLRNESACALRTLPVSRRKPAAIGISLRRYSTTNLRPLNLAETLAALAANPLTILAGGTDFYPARVGAPVLENIVDVTRIPSLRGITQSADHWRIGATTTWTDLIRAPLPNYVRTLKLAAREVGGMQIQNAGTIAGNICNASPAADGVPPLLALGAEIELSSASSKRRVALTDFISGNRKTLRQPDELVTAILVPKWSDRARSTFLKLGARKYLLISIAMVAVCVDTDADGIIRRAGISVGACSPVAKRLVELEAKLVGQLLNAAVADLVEPSDLRSLVPIDDVRASADYRLDAALTLIRRALTELANE